MGLFRLLGILSILCCLVAVSGNEDGVEAANVRSDGFSLSSIANYVLGWLKSARGGSIYGGRIAGKHIARINQGRTTIKGQTNDHAYSFYAIPYAEAPVGARRFMPPVEKGFQATIDASIPNPVKCYQYAGKNMSEDCLVLNVHVPKTRKDGELLPVMVWIHGGAFRFGAGTDQANDGRFFSSSTNTVVVTLNYRLGAFGFLVFEEDGVKFNGNQGLKDQQLALKWVRDHIRGFGGDPDKVTIFGESAGAQSVMFHLASKVSTPYFKRAIMQSNPAAYDYPTIPRATKVGEKLVEGLGCAKKYDSSIQCLRKVDPAFVIKTTIDWNTVDAAAKKDIRSIAEPFRPVVDGDEFPKQPLTMFKEGNWNTDVDVIIGTNRQEMFLAPLVPAKMNVLSHRFWLINYFTFGLWRGGRISRHYLKSVSSTKKNYNSILSAVIGDYLFVCSTRMLARFISKTSTSKNTYLYSYEHSSTKDPNKYYHYSCHACEIPYVFKTTKVSNLPNGKEEKKISEMFSDLWGSFAYSGVPTSNLCERWSKYDGASDKDLHIEYPRGIMEAHHEKKRCDYWDWEDYYSKL